MINKVFTVEDIIENPVNAFNYIKCLQEELTEKNRILAELAVILDSYKSDNIDG